MKMGCYHKYKSSDVDWLDDIPEHWQITKLRWFVNTTSGDYLSNEDVEKGDDSEYRIPVIGGNGILGYTNRINCDNDVLVIGRVGALCGNVHIIDVNCWVTDNALIVKVSENFYIKYLYFLIVSLNLNSLANKNAQPLITGEMVKSQHICLPPFAEQKTIATFLDHKTAQIDKLIAEKERLLTLLEEKRIALITEAVTKGLDQNVKMKPSGIDWLGDIPEHWEVIPLRYLNKKIQTGSTPPSTGEDYFNGGEIDWFTPGDFHSNDIYLKEARRRVRIEALSDGLLNAYPANSVLIIGIGATLGKVGISNRICSSNQQINAIIVNDKISPMYLAYFLLVNQEILKLFSNSTTLGILNQERTKMISICLPSLAEQEHISNYIVENTNSIFRLVDLIRTAIEKLKEYRTSLITAAVTGKIDVRDYKPEESNEKVH